ncbi:MAG: caspase family protein, partial [Pseudomonadota bacterium]
MASPTLAADERLALVIGNSAYAHVSALENPGNDATDISAALTKAGFSVDTRFDLDQQGMLRALQEFGQRSLGAEMAVIYYAGHGIEVERQNYLIPVSAKLATDIDVAFEAVQLDRALLAVGGAEKLRLVIVDACRDNPFAGQMRSTSPTRSIGRGLAAVEPSAATLVAYAAKEGTVANDGQGRNSPYAAALLEALDEPGLEIGKLFRKVRDSVLRKTGGTQEPFVYGSIPAYDLFLYPASLVEEPTTPGATAIAPQPRSLDLVFWDAISNSTDPRDFQEFVERFPDSVFAGIAARRAELLMQDAEGPSDPGEQQIASLPDTVQGDQLPTTPNLSQPEGEPPELTRDLLRGVQLQLNALGHNSGIPDGIMGRRTRNCQCRFWCGAPLCHPGCPNCVQAHSVAIGPRARGLGSTRAARLR